MTGQRGSARQACCVGMALIAAAVTVQVHSIPASWPVVWHDNVSSSCDSISGSVPGWPRSKNGTVRLKADDDLTSIATGVSLYLPLNGSTQPRAMNGSSTELVDGNVSEVVGVVDGALRLSAESSVILGVPCNIPTLEGTISLWVNWAGAMPFADDAPVRTATTTTITLFRFIGVQAEATLSCSSPHNCSAVVSFDTGGIPAGDWNGNYRFDYLQSATLSDNHHAWHHVALSFNTTGWKSVTLDGAQTTGSSVLVPANTSPVATPADKFFLGTMVPYNVNAVAVSLDELVVWNRVLTSSEVQFLYAQPHRSAAILDDHLPLYSPNRPAVTFSLFLPSAPVDTILEPSQLFNASTVVQSHSATPLSIDLTAQLRGFWSVLNATVQTNLSNVSGTRNLLVLDAGASAVVSFSLRAPAERGTYTLDVAGRFQDHPREITARSIAAFVVWPLPLRRTLGCTETEQWFGSHMYGAPACRYNKFVGCRTGAFIDQSRRLGYCGPVRDHDFLQSTKMNFVEPEQGQFAFLDAESITLFAHAGYPVLGNFAQAPEWAANLSGVRSNGQNVSAPCPGSSLCHPPREDAFAEYVRRTLVHYGRNVSRYEFFNEPAGNAFWGGTVDQYTRLAHIARTVIDEVAATTLWRPELLIGAFGGYGAESYQLELAKAGALKYADAVSFHLGPQDPHRVYGFDTAETYYQLLSARIEFFRNLSRAHTDVANGSELPVWNTEGGSTGTTFLLGLGESGAGMPPSRCLPPLNYRTDAARTVFAEALMQSLGLKAHYYYYQADYTAAVYETDSSSGFSNTNMLDLTLAPKPKLLARLHFAERIKHCVLPPQLVRATHAVWCFVYACPSTSSVSGDTEGGSVALVWNAGSIPLALQLPRASVNRSVVTGLWDVFGNALDIGAACSPRGSTRDPIACAVSIQATSDPGYMASAVPAHVLADALRLAYAK